MVGATRAARFKLATCLGAHWLFVGFALFCNEKLQNCPYFDIGI